MSFFAHTFRLVKDNYRDGNDLVLTERIFEYEGARQVGFEDRPETRITGFYKPVDESHMEHISETLNESID